MKTKKTTKPKEREQKMNLENHARLIETAAPFVLDPAIATAKEQGTTPWQVIKTMKKRFESLGYNSGFRHYLQYIGKPLTKSNRYENRDRDFANYEFLMRLNPLKVNDYLVEVGEFEALNSFRDWD